MSHALAIADLFRAAFAADAAFTGTACLGDTSGANRTLPNLTFKVEAVPISGDGKANEFTLYVWVENGVTGETEEARIADATAHKTLTTLVATKLHGTGKAALLDAVNESTAYEIHGTNAAPDAPGIEGHHFRTAIVCTGSATAL